MIPPLPTDIFSQAQVLNNTYEIEGVLGRGGTGEVYRARNLVSGRVVAIKALARQFSANEDYIDLMRREEEMRDIAHDAVVRYTECSRSDDGHVFLVMDYIEGPSLDAESRRRQFEPRELLILGHRVAEGLHAAHARGIIHRDLSPDNIILRDGAVEKATIIDFGIAKDTAAGARTIVGNSFAGKYEYAAPEQLEGRVDVRSDLYALGASLLAAWRGEIPDVGTTPGEIVRRKREALDTGGVPEPLKGVIDRLAAPSPAARPATTAAALELFEGALRQVRDSRRPAGQGGRAPRRRGVLPAVLSLLFAAALVALWQFGALQRFLTPELPVAAPYRLVASVDGAPQLSGNVPDADSETLLRRAFGTATGAMPPEGGLTLAAGVPSPEWPVVMAELIAATGGLEGWTLEAQDLSVHLAGLAPDGESRDRKAAELSGIAAEAGIDLDLRLAAGPRILPARTVADALASHATCGPLALNSTADGYAMGDTVRVTGDIAAPGDEAAIRDALARVVGDRAVRVETEVVNPSVCAIRAMLPDLPSGRMSVRMSDGQTGGLNPSGVYGVGANPVVDIELPVSLDQGWLAVALVGNTGQVFNLIPNIAAPEHRIDRLGVVENGIRRIRVLHSVAEFGQDNTKLAFRVSADDFGKSEIVAFVSQEPLFDVRRPRDESVESFAQGLAEAQARNPGNLVAIARRVLEARP